MPGWAMLHEHVVRHNVLFIISATQCIYPEDFSICLKLKCFNRAYVFPICYFKSFLTICKISIVNYIIVDILTLNVFASPMNST